MEINHSNSNREKIAVRLKEARILSGLSQEQAASKLGLQRPAISEVESGKRKVSAEEIIRFADMYKVNTSWLLLEEGEETEEFKFAARELSKLDQGEVQKLLSIIKILPK